MTIALACGCMGDRIDEYTRSDELMYAPETRTTMQKYTQLEFHGMYGRQLLVEWTRIPGENACTTQDDVVVDLISSGRRVHCGVCPEGWCNYTASLGETVNQVDVYGLCESKVRVTIS